MSVHEFRVACEVGDARMLAALFVPGVTIIVDRGAVDTRLRPIRGVASFLNHRWEISLHLAEQVFAPCHFERISLVVLAGGTSPRNVSREVVVTQSSTLTKTRLPRRRTPVNLVASKLGVALIRWGMRHSPEAVIVIRPHTEPWPINEQHERIQPYDPYAPGGLYRTVGPPRQF